MAKLRSRLNPASLERVMITIDRTTAPMQVLWSAHSDPTDWTPAEGVALTCARHPGMRRRRPSRGWARHVRRMKARA